MLPAHLLICERTSAWAVAWRRALRGKLRVQETRTLPACQRELAAFPASVVGLEATVASAAELGLIVAAWREQHPQCVVLVLGSSEIAPWDAYFREAGAADVLLARREVPRAASLAVRHIQRFPPALPEWKQAILAKLPWSLTPHS